MNTFNYQWQRIAIVASRFNHELVDMMLENALTVLKAAGFPDDAITVYHAPGAFELPILCQQLAKSGQYDALMAFGLVIKGETAHFEYICDAATQGLMKVSLSHDIPITYGVLTTYTSEQAKNRVESSGRNKGAEVAEALLQTLSTIEAINQSA